MERRNTPVGYFQRKQNILPFCSPREPISSLPLLIANHIAPKPTPTFIEGFNPSSSSSSSSLPPSLPDDPLDDPPFFLMIANLETTVEEMVRVFINKHAQHLVLDTQHFTLEYEASRLDPSLVFLSPSSPLYPSPKTIAFSSSSHDPPPPPPRLTLQLLDNNPPLSCLLRYAHLTSSKIVNLLQQHPSPHLLRDGGGRTLLHSFILSPSSSSSSSSSSSLKVLSVLVKGLGGGERDWREETAVNYAVLAGKVEVFFFVVFCFLCIFLYFK